MPWLVNQLNGEPAHCNTSC